MSTTTARIDFHKGETLLNLANTYPKLSDVLLELVQNALDEKANRIWIEVDYKNRKAHVQDNGQGASIDKFNGALGSVAKPGRKEKGSLGQFGIGLISPLGKCKKFFFVSCPQPHDSLYQEWLLETDHIKAQQHDISIPTKVRQDIIFEKKVPGKNSVDWRSRAQLIDFTEDQFVSQLSMDGLVGGIQDRYSGVMRKNNVVISVVIKDEKGKKHQRDNVTALEFLGRKLLEQELLDSGGGKVLFRLFIAKKIGKGRQRQGKVSMGVMGNDFRFPFEYFARSAASLLKPDVVDALSKGLFEGEILSEKARLHRDRQTFEKDDNWIGLCIAIEEWFDKFGREHTKEAQQSNEDERHQELGLRSMKVVEDMLRDPSSASLLAVLKSFERGTVGSGHTDVPASKVYGQQDEKALSVDGNVGESKSKKDDGEPPPDPTKPPEHKPDHMPLTVAGPKGKRRKEVRGHSTGLGFVYDAMDGSPDLWKLDIKNGLLHFNIRHPLWMACDSKSDLALMKLQELVTIQALTLEIMPEGLRHCQRQAFDEHNGAMVTWILNSDKARGSIPAAKKKPAKTKP